MSRPLLLLVDDAPEIGLIVQHLGKRAGQNVVCCADAVAAWNYLRDSVREGGETPKPQLILLDVNLPGMSGVDLCRRLRSVTPFARLPVALFSHWDRPEDVAAGLEAGANYVVSKDLLCHPEGWQQRLGEILNGADSRPAWLSLSWTGSQVHSLSPEGCNGFFRQAERLLGPLVLRVVIRRAVRKVGTPFPEVWLAPDGLGLAAEALARPTRPEAVAIFLIAVARQTWNLLGTAASTPCWEALAVALPSLSRSLPC